VNERCARSILTVTGTNLQVRGHTSRPCGIGQEPPSSLVTALTNQAAETSNSEFRNALLRISKRPHHPSSCRAHDLDCTPRQASARGPSEIWLGRLPPGRDPALSPARRLATANRAFRCFPRALTGPGASVRFDASWRASSDPAVRFPRRGSQMRRVIGKFVVAVTVTAGAASSAAVIGRAVAAPNPAPASVSSSSPLSTLPAPVTTVPSPPVTTSVAPDPITSAPASTSPPANSNTGLKVSPGLAPPSERQPSSSSPMLAPEDAKEAAQKYVDRDPANRAVCAKPDGTVTVIVGRRVNPSSEPLTAPPNAGCLLGKP